MAGAGLGQDLFWYRRTIEVPRDTANRNRTLHIDAALEGDFNLGSTAWNWSVGVNHNNVIGTDRQHGNLNLVTLKKALGPSFLNAAGVVQCGTAGRADRADRVRTVQHPRRPIGIDPGSTEVRHG